MSEDIYDAAYYDHLRRGAHRSAERVLPLLFERLHPESVVDFGCGSGEWLATAGALGADIYGVDGPWVSAEMLGIAGDRFEAADLAAPVDLGRRFDLALCLEVAEHLPETAADTLVETLVRHAPAVLFSAAVPGQGGADHVTERWPSYWAGRFADAGYDCLDPRGAIWDDSGIEPWYRQNLLVFVRQDHSRSSALADLEGTSPAWPLVHPAIWQARLKAFEDARADMQADLHAARNEVARIGGEWQTLADERDALNRQIADHHETIRQITASRSWRLTAPLRWIDARLSGRR